MTKRAIFISLAVILLVGATLACGASTPEVALPQGDDEATNTLAPRTADTIDWDEAEDYVGERKTVCGPVVGTHYASSTSGEPTFVNVGREYPDPDRLTVIIWGRNRNSFPSSPERLYSGEDICVTGLIELYESVVEIEARDPSDVEIH